MALRFVLGVSGSGKSTWLIDHVIHGSMAQSDVTWLYIVPEQFTMATQRELVEHHPRGGILNIDVLSFQRLAYRVFDEVGGFFVPVLDDIGKTLVLRKVVEEQKDRLSVLKNNLKKPGAIDELKSVISEFTQYNVAPEQLAELAVQMRDPGLKRKLADLQTLYAGFFQYMEDKFITSEQVLSVLAGVIDRWKKLEQCVVVLDGFTGFTPLQCVLLGKILPRAKDVLVTVTVDPGLYKTSIPRQQVFALSGKTMERLLDIAEKTGTEAETPVVLGPGSQTVSSKADRGTVSGNVPAGTASGDVPPRFLDSPALAFLEKHLFRYHRHTYDKDQQEIFLWRSHDPAEEAAEAAAVIRRLAREEGYRYGEIAVVSGAMDRYSELCLRIFAQYGIPCYFDNSPSLVLNPMLEMLYGLVEMLDTDFTPDSVFRYLRSGLTGYSREDIDRLENYVLARGIRRWGQWQEPWVVKAKNMTPEELAHCNSLREQFVEELSALRECWKGTATVEERTRSLYTFLVEQEYQNKLDAHSHLLEAEGHAEESREYGQVYAIVLHVLEQMIALLGPEAITTEEYGELLEAGFRTAKIGILPPGSDYVILGDVERTRLSHIKVLLFIGVNDGVIPKSADGGGILSEMDRESLKEGTVELAPTARDNYYIQRFYLYQLLTKPSEKLYVSYSTAGEDGSEISPSYLVADLKRLFPRLEVRNADVRKDRYDGLENLTEAKDFIFRRRQDGQGWEQPLLETLSRRDDYKEMARLLAAAGHFANTDTSLGRELAKYLYANYRYSSITRLEQYASCPFSHFARYGLELAERELYEFAPADNGNVFHYALELYANILAQRGLAWQDPDQPLREQLSERCIEDSLTALGITSLARTARGRYQIRRMKTVMERTVWALGRQMAAGKFDPANYELDFSGKGLTKLSLFGGSETMEFGGRIDRVDMYEEGGKQFLKVIDYKTGNKKFSLMKFYYGLQLQLVVYMEAAMELARAKHPKKTQIPAGIFYYHLKDPVVEWEGEYDRAEVEKKQLIQLRPDGYVNDGYIHDLFGADYENGPSGIVPISLKNGKLLASSSHALTTEQMGGLMSHGRVVMRQLAQEIMEGETKVSPYVTTSQNACEYCSYKGVCHFDRRTDRGRKLETLSDKQVLERLEE